MYKKIIPSAVLLAASTAGVGVAFGGTVISEVLLGLALGTAVVPGLVHAGQTRGLVTATVLAAVVTGTWNAVRVVDPLTLSDLGLVTALGLVVTLVLRRRASAGSLPQAYAVGVLIVSMGGVAGSVFAVDVLGGLGNLARFVIGAILIPMLFVLWAPSRQEMRQVVWAWVLSGCISSAVGLYQVLAAGAVAPTGLATHYNHFAITCLLTLGPAVGLAASSQGWPRAVGGFASLLLVGGVVASGSRAGLLGGVALIVLLIGLSRSDLRRAALVTGGIATAVLIGLAAFMQAPIALPLSVNRLLGLDPTLVDGSNLARLQLLTSNLDRFQNSPIVGIGFGLAGDAHDIYLQILVSAGAIGLLGMLMMMAVLLARVGPRLLDERASWLPREVGVGLLSSWIAFLVAGTFQNALLDRYVWVVPALMVAAIAHPQDAAVAEAAPGPTWRPKPAST